MAQIDVLPCCKISGQGITLYNEIHYYDTETGTEFNPRKKTDQAVSKSNNQFCAFFDKKPGINTIINTTPEPLKLRPYKDQYVISDMLYPDIIEVPCSLVPKTNIFKCNYYRQKEGKELSENPCKLCDSCAYKYEKEKINICRNTPENLDIRSIAAMKNSIYALLWMTKCKYKSGTKIVTYPKKKITFATLTLPSEQQHSDIFLKKQCLDQFFIEMRKKNNDLLYIWRSEKQQNGNVHFHILLNHFYDYLTLSSQWNRITDKYDYVKNYTRKFERMNLHDYISNYSWDGNTDYQLLVKRYRKGCQEHWQNPNSTDIDFIHAVENVPGYITKEMTKKNNNGGSAVGESKWKFPATGRAWSCSQDITAKSGWSGIVPDSIRDELSRLDRIIPNKKWENNYITHYSLSPDLFLEYKLPRLFDFYMNFLRE